jgi:tetrahydromethanopterin S-methyltransferase subunit F
VVEVNKMAEEAKAAGPIRMVAIDNMVENIRYKAQILARTNKLDSAVTASGLIGFTAGVLTALVMVIVPAFLV